MYYRSNHDYAVSFQLYEEGFTHLVLVAAMSRHIQYRGSTLELIHGSEDLAQADALHSGRLQLYFMCPGIDYMKGELPTFFVAKGSPHEDYYRQVGGICAAVDPANPAGYVGGLAGNKASAVGMYGESACTTRDYMHMRKQEMVPPVCKGGQTPLFGPPAWEELHALLRQLLYSSTNRFKYSDDERMFSNSSDDELRELYPEGIAVQGQSIQCFLRNGRVGITSINGTELVGVDEALKYGIERCMDSLRLRYSNAVFDGVASIEDSGFAFFHYF